MDLNHIAFFFFQQWELNSELIHAGKCFPTEPYLYYHVKVFTQGVQWNPALSPAQELGPVVLLLWQGITSWALGLCGPAGMQTCRPSLIPPTGVHTHPQYTPRQIRERFDRMSQRHDFPNSHETSTGKTSYLGAIQKQSQKPRGARLDQSVGEEFCLNSPLLVLCFS